MKKLKIITLFLFITLPIIGSSNYNLSTDKLMVNNPDSLYTSQKIIFKKIGISIDIIDTWKTKKNNTVNTITFKLKKKNSYFKISTNSNSNEKFDKAFDESIKNCYEGKLLESINNMNRLPNSDITSSFSISKIENDIETIKLFKIIDNKRVLAEGFLNTNCSECKDEFLFMIASIAVIN